MTLPAQDIVERLRKAMEGVTPGPYIVTTCADFWLEAGSRGFALFGDLSWRGAETTINNQCEMEANARFHALCSPDNIGALLDTISRLTALEAEIGRLQDALKPFATYLDTAKYDLDNLGRPLPDDLGMGWVYLTVGNFRRARSVLANEEAGQ